METLYFIAKVNAFPQLTVRYGKPVSYNDHYYVIDSGGELHRRHSEEVFKDEESAWTKLYCAYSAWLKIYE